MLCCSVSHVPKDTVNVYQVKERDARITGLALGMIALLLFATACILYGVGTLPPTELMGFGMFPYLGGTFLSFLSLGVLVGAITFSVIAAVRACQIDQLSRVADPKMV
jgi:hypothetical protein